MIIARSRVSRPNASANAHNGFEPSPARSVLLHVESDLAFAHLLALDVRRWKEASYAGLATSGAAALALCREAIPDVVLLDLQLDDDMDGFELVAELQKLPRQPRIMVLSACVTPLALLRLATLPIAALISKLSCEPGTLRTAFREVVAGRAYFSSDIGAQFTAFRRASNAFHKILSDRELDLLPLFGAGLDDLQIGDRSGISAQTAKRHRASVLAKLGLHSTPALMRWAAETGFVSYRSGGLRLHRAHSSAPRNAPPSVSLRCVGTLVAVAAS
jgi:DNA-binding NarL/FixJ family response regulator